MICCSNCFNDQELIAEIQNIGRKGECPICGAKDVLYMILNWIIMSLHWKIC